MPSLRLDVSDVRQLPLTHRTVVPEEYLDAMGHMNVMWYTHLFSMAMGGLFDLVGLTWEEIRHYQGGTFALESHNRYLAEVRVGETIEIHSRLLDRTEKRFHAMHFMTNQTQENVAASFEVVGAYIDLRSRRMAPFPDRIAAQLDWTIGEHRKLRWPAPTSGVMSP